MKKLLLLTMAAVCGLGCVCVSHGSEGPPSYEEATQKECQACTFLNNADARFCAICGAAFDQRPAGAGREERPARVAREEDMVRAMRGMSLAPEAPGRRAAPDRSDGLSAQAEADSITEIGNSRLRILGSVDSPDLFEYQSLFGNTFAAKLGSMHQGLIYGSAFKLIENAYNNLLDGIATAASRRFGRTKEEFMTQAAGNLKPQVVKWLQERQLAGQGQQPVALDIPARAQEGGRSGSMSSGEYARRMDAMMGGEAVSGRGPRADMSSEMAARDFLARRGKEFEQKCPAGCGSAIGQHDLEHGQCGICYRDFAPRRQAAEQPARGRFPLAEEGSEEDFIRAPRRAGPARPAAAVASPAALQGLRMARATVQEKASPDGSWEGWLDVPEKGDRVRIKVTGSAIGRRGLGLNQFSNFYYIDTAGNILPKGLFYWQRAQKVAPKPQEGEARFERGVWVKYKFGAKQGDRGVEWNESKIKEEHPWK
ncbi:MAG: hypothetical protein NT124_02405 [Candidatus Dependentiae bacterium]|nr:hypothetical protein [Candidatus Dependentiae bacterium]